MLAIKWHDCEVSSLNTSAKSGEDLTMYKYEPIKTPAAITVQNMTTVFGIFWESDITASKNVGAKSYETFKIHQTIPGKK